MTYQISNFSDGCWYVRCYLPMLFNGFSGDKEGFSIEKDRKRDAQMVVKADTIVYQRPDDYKKLESALLLKKAGKKIVFENDDTYKEIYGLTTIELEKRNRILNTFIKIADLVTTTTEYLANEYREINPNVVVLKNYVNPKDWPTPKRNQGDKIRIGIFGSAVLNGDSDGIKELLDALNKRDDVQLVTFGFDIKQKGEYKEIYKDDIKFWKGLRIERHNYVTIDKYFRTLNDLELDFCLIPRKDNYFNRCKSNIKFLEASMLNIPCIAQGFEDGKSPYQGEEDSKYMLIAKNLDDWKQHTYKLINSPTARKIMGVKAHQYVLENYNIKEHAHEWATAYKTLNK